MPTYSHSRLGAYENCPLKYKYLYIDRLDRDRRPSIESFMGSLVHSAMEKLYDELSHEKTNSLQELIEYYDASWQKDWTDDIQIVKKQYTADHYRQLGQRCIRDYYARYQPFNQTRTLGIERQIFVKLRGGHQMTGYIDRLSQQPDGTYEIHDYKTGGHLPGQSDLDQDRQLALYQIGIQQEFRDAERMRLVWHYLAFDKSLMSQRESDQLRELTERTVELIREIEAAKEFPPRKSALCSWCEFQDICPIWKHPVKLQEDRPAAPRIRSAPRRSMRGSRAALRPRGPCAAGPRAARGSHRPARSSRGCSRAAAWPRQCGRRRPDASPRS